MHTVTYFQIKNKPTIKVMKILCNTVYSYQLTIETISQNCSIPIATTSLGVFKCSKATRSTVTSMASISSLYALSRSARRSEPRIMFSACIANTYSAATKYRRMASPKTQKLRQTNLKVTNTR